MNPKNVTPSRSNVYHAVSLKTTHPPIHSDMSISAIIAMETFQSDIDNVKEDVQGIKTGMKKIQKMLQQLITPPSTVKTTVSTESPGLMSSTSGTYPPPPLVGTRYITINH
jgi:prophage DNA circulation protein